MSSESDSGEKSYEPSAHKLAEARRKGDVPKSMDLSAAAGFIGLWLALTISGAGLINDAGGLLSQFMANSDRLTGAILGSGGAALSGSMIPALLWALSPLLILPIVAALLSLIAQQGFTFAPDKLSPKLNRINIISNAQNKFGPTGLVQFLKSVVKMAAACMALYAYLSTRADDFLGAVRGESGAVVLLIGETVVALLGIACLIFLAVGAVDYFWQQYDHNRKLRMTHQEMRDEHKQTEGDPHLKNQRNQRRNALATNRMLLDVPEADVLVVNPTHFATALKWSREAGSAPICVAKGADEIAARIREIASENGVPIYRDPPTARAIFANVEIGDEIEASDYRAVAAAIRYADEIKQKFSGNA